MAKSMSIKLEFVAPLPQIAITRFTYNAVEFYGPQGPRYKEVDLYKSMETLSCHSNQSSYLTEIKNITFVEGNVLKVSMPGFGFILFMVSEKKIFKHFYEN